MAKISDKYGMKSPKACVLKLVDNVLEKIR